MRPRHRPPGAEPFPGFTGAAEIGRGSVFAVFRAVEADTARPVALRVFDPTGRRVGVESAFEQQLRVLGAVSGHPHVVSFHRTARSAEGRPVLVVELCEGSLARRLRAAWRPSPAEVVTIGIKLAGALESAHAAGHVHRDVGPGRVLVTAYGEPALSGFGTAAVREAAGVPPPAPTHAAPEVLEGGPLGPATDVYGLASTLYELLTGRTPFAGMEGEPPAATILRIVRDPVAPVVSPGVPLALSDLLVAALSKSPGDRPRSAAELAGRLAGVAQAEGWAAPAPLYPGAETAPVPATWVPPRARPAPAAPASRPPAGEPVPPAPEPVAPAADPVPAPAAAQRTATPQRATPAPRPSVVAPAAGERRVARAVPVAERPPAAHPLPPPGPVPPPPPPPAPAAGEEVPGDPGEDSARGAPRPSLPPLQAEPPPRRGRNGWRTGRDRS